MKRHVRPALIVERLEERDCPALSIINNATILTVRGTPTSNLSITGTATANLFTFMDGAKFLGNFKLNRDLYVQLTTEPGTVHLNMHGNTITGNALFSLGNGFTGVGLGQLNIYDDLATGPGLGAGTIRGSLTVLGGNGNENVTLGVDPTFANTPMTVRGNVTAVGKASTSGVDNFNLGDGSVVRGSMTITNFEGVSLGNQDITTTAITTVGGQTSITTASVGAGLLVTLVGRFGNNVTVNGAASSPFFNAFTLEPVDPGVNSQISGSLNVRFGQALNGNTFQIIGDATETSIVTGNVNFTSTNQDQVPSDDVGMYGQINGSLTVNLGNGTNNFDFGPSPIDASNSGVIFGNLSYTGGNGTNNFGTGANNLVTGMNAFTGLLVGNLTVNVGSGDNAISLQTGIGGKFTFRGGNGSDDVSLVPTTPALFLVDMVFGAGDNTLTLNANDTMSGYIRGTGGNNTFNQNGATLLPTLYLINFP